MKWLYLCAFAAQLSAAQATENPATDEFSAQRRIRPIATRIEIYPSSRQIRRCVDWYAIERRPSGEVITPHMRCWWATR
ncbi:MAG: hypothetical protein ACXWJW_14890 [Xanthobacteraceae bacterium]